MQQVESFQVVMQLFVLPMFFLAGAIFPLHGLPTWLSFLTKIDPLAYIVDPMRHAVFTHLNLSEEAMHALSPGIAWRLGGADRPVAGDRGGHGAGHDVCGHCHIQQARVVRSQIAKKK